MIRVPNGDAERLTGVDPRVRPGTSNGARSYGWRRRACARLPDCTGVSPAWNSRKGFRGYDRNSGILSPVGKAADRSGIHVSVRSVRRETVTVRRDVPCDRFPELARSGSGIARGLHALSGGPYPNL